MLVIWYASGIIRYGFFVWICPQDWRIHWSIKARGSNTPVDVQWGLNWGCGPEKTGVKVGTCLLESKSACDSDHSKKQIHPKKERFFSQNNPSNSSIIQQIKEIVLLLKGVRLTLLPRVVTGESVVLDNSIDSWHKWLEPKYRYCDSYNSYRTQWHTHVSARVLFHLTSLYQLSFDSSKLYMYARLEIRLCVQDDLKSQNYPVKLENTIPLFDYAVE